MKKRNLLGFGQLADHGSVTDRTSVLLAEGKPHQKAFISIHVSLLSAFFDLFGGFSKAKEA
jgi:hypothetical protein